MLEQAVISSKDRKQELQINMCESGLYVTIYQVDTDTWDKVLQAWFNRQLRREVKNED